MITSVVGLNWGDEGKGRMVDYFAGKADCVIRYQGGDNAGHTVVNELGKFAFHNFPSGVCYPGVINIIASGSVVSPDSFIAELKDVESKGLKVENIYISDRAILIMPYAKILEKLEEERLKDKKYGSTMSGIAPTYGYKYLKKGIQAGELLYPEYLEEHVRDVVTYANLQISAYGAKPVDADEILAYLREYAPLLKPYITNTKVLVDRLLSEGKSIIVEAQLGALRDITHGIYPYTTSSSTLSGNACAAIPVPPSSIKRIVGITKAYSTCVGEGPFTTEIFGDLAHQIRETGHEYGAKTGRPRRIGYFDAVATRYGCTLQGATDMTVTCLDVLTGIEELKICTAYEINGVETPDFPINCTLSEAKPVYKTVRGWSEDITGIRKFENLPKEARAYLKEIENLTGTRISYVSVGPERDALITI
ncbi:MAG TPA: adenylosuccinate synthase [Clostridia bacterium]|nr:adenylosuccinate synthase [Clostridia bacterium]